MWRIKQTRTQPLTDQGGNVIYSKFNIWPCKFPNYTPDYGSATWMPVYDALGSGVILEDPEKGKKRNIKRR